ncbi:MAG: C-terminal helicase domain-containing protein, partial [Candidatus Diapherotrites archaeon]|nr:C-terminal helicase domain-containing protein [Candidatus Diapherotrites archaeon]
TKREVDKVARNLKKQGIEAMPVHGDLAQNKRQHAVELFKHGKIDVLVATDVAARGLDIKDVTHVYNYDVPRTPDEYTHRIGRTARAGKKGDAVTLLSERDYDNFDKILRYGKMEIREVPLPFFEVVEYKNPVREYHSFGHTSRRPAYGQHEDRRNSQYGDRRNNSRTGSLESNRYGQSSRFPSNPYQHKPQEQQYPNNSIKWEKTNSSPFEAHRTGNKIQSTHKNNNYSGQDNNKNHFKHQKRW